MKNECPIVRDLLPLYTENMLSGETAEFVKEHLSRCPACAGEAVGVREREPQKTEITLPLTLLQKKLRRKRLLAAALGLLIAAVALICVFAALNTPEFFPYSDALMSMEAEGDDLIVSFSPSVTDFSIQSSREPESETALFTIEAWTSRWDSMRPSRGSLQTVIEGGAEAIVFYAQNNGEEDVCIFGWEKLSGGMMTLPALRLGYYLIITALLFVLLAAARVIFRRSRARGLLEIAALYPLSYLLSHLVLGIGTVSYSFMRDFTLVLSVSVLIFLALLLVRELWKCIK